MAGVYIDEDVVKVFVHLLQVDGHTVRHARTTPGMSGATDSHQLLFAAQRGSVLLTHNGKDFLLLHDAWRRWTAAWRSTHAHEGILLIPQHVPAAIVARAVSDHLADNPPLRNEFYEWHHARRWQHIPYRA
jgi:hypothetical protein